MHFFNEYLICIAQSIRQQGQGSEKRVRNLFFYFAKTFSFHLTEYRSFAFEFNEQNDIEKAKREEN